MLLYEFTLNYDKNCVQKTEDEYYNYQPMVHFHIIHQVLGVVIVYLSVKYLVNFE